MTNNKFTLAALGCTGKVSEIFIDGFIQQGIHVRILARNPEEIIARYPSAEVIKGSMMNAEDTAKVMVGVDAAFLVTPMGICNNTSMETNAVKAAIEGARAINLKHLIHISSIGIDQPWGVPLLDAKYESQRLLASSGIPYTSIRCGSYMEDVIDNRIAAIKNGLFLFPVTKNRKFTYTSQKDIPRFVVQELLETGYIMNGSFNFVSPGTLTPLDLEKMMTAASGHKVKASGKFPLYYALILLQPYFNWRKHRLSTIVPLLRYFDKYGYTATGETVSDIFPEFRMTTVQEHIQALLQ